MRLKDWSLGIAVMLPATLGGCGLTDVVCTDEAIASLNVTVVDSASADPLMGAVVWVEDGVYQDTLEGGNGTWYGPWERAGTYDVHVQHSGFRSWSTSDVTVEQGRCHVRPRSLTARLQAAE
jgi:hypothetical protein